MGMTQVPPVEGTREGREVFAARRATTDAVAAAFFGLLGIGIFFLASAAAFGRGRSGSLWAVGLPALVLLGGVAALLLWRYFDDRPILKLSDAGLKAKGLKTPLRWAEIEDVEYDERRMRLVLHLPSEGRKRKTQAISLARLKKPQRAVAFQSILARVSAKRQGQGLEEPRTARDLRDVAEFEQKLLELTPSVWSTGALVALNAGVWLVQVAGGLHPFAPSAESLYRAGGNSAWAVVLDGQQWRMLTATFMHAGLLHLVFNMIGLWEPSRQFARQNGNGQLLLVYLASALCGSAASLHFSAQAAVSVGASGAVFGVLGALLASCWKYRRQLPRLNSKRLWSGAGAFTLYALVQGFGSARVDNAAHLGGLACGALLGLLLVARFDKEHTQERVPQAVLGGLVAAVATVAGLVTTPLPRTWHGPVFDGARIVTAAAPQLELLGKDAERFAGRDASDPELRAFLRRDVLPRCDAFRAQARQVQVPGWERVGQAVALLGRQCRAMEVAARLDLQAAGSEERAAAIVRLQALQGEVKAATQELAKLMAGASKGKP